MRCATAIVSVLALVACAHTQVWAATGESIDALGQAYLATSHALKAAHAVGKVDDVQYAKWTTFAAYFRVTYDAAADRWLHADDTASQNAAAVLAALSSELAVYVELSGRATQ